MDFLHKLKHGEEKHTYEDSSTQTDVEKEPEKKHFFDKLRHKDDEDDVKKPEVVKHHETAGSSKDDSEKKGGHGDFLVGLIAGRGEKEKLEAERREKEEAERLERERVERERLENESFIDKLKHKIDHDEAALESSSSHHAKPAEPVEEPSFFDKITGKAAEDERRRKVEEEERRRKEEAEKNALEKLKDRLEEKVAEAGGHDGKSERKEGEHHFLDKITGKAEEEERRRREDAAKNPFEKLSDKLDESLGGGRKAEEKEDLLDKTIDKFQEHILKAGDQSDESALEQMKDEKIADMIRGRLNIKDKEDK